MKKYGHLDYERNMYSILSLSISIFGIIATTSRIKNVSFENAYENQLELVSETLSDVQDEPSMVNSYHLLELQRFKL